MIYFLSPNHHFVFKLRSCQRFRHHRHHCSHVSSSTKSLIVDPNFKSMLNCSFSFGREQLSSCNDTKLAVSKMRTETMQMRDAEKKKKKKKTWRRILSFLLTFKQKSGEEEKAPVRTEPLKLSCSGGLFAHLLQKRVRLTPSGTLSSCFTPSMAEEDSEVPYKCLEHQNQVLGAKPFGPIYLVT
ncbi:uncharacterized protein LOC121973473 isoform X1 [Zingiber officinale]|uniref:uncharacterized protein LOC121973473 isoform X1 n=1 Tax=Zingiber officinale TaxID=94328 RepID=UPI001C4D0524|nr:uncharacterized protein LOC121973473 isoform X1 [Zingiber officinale]